MSLLERTPAANKVKVVPEVTVGHNRSYWRQSCRGIECIGHQTDHHKLNRRKTTREAVPVREQRGVRQVW